ncbi:phage virion morphogenesis protein [Paraburkholderia fungorum]|uniref:phage virion morphogenesis protein n=1 Tax=Paraburkholderia fungorum TaxID=134537 RepID=UPI00402B4D73
MTELRLAMKDEVSGELGRLRRRISHPDRLMRAISVELLSITEGNFAKEASDGDNWKKLAEETIKQRKKKGCWPGQILQISAGGLAASIKPFSSAQEAGIGVSKIYAAIHQLGGQAGRGRKVTIPARPYLPMRKDGDGFELTRDAREGIMDIMELFVSGKVL